jgi:hypothetical protein
LSTLFKARPPARAVIAATACATVGLAMGGAYLMGSVSRAMTTSDQAQRLAPAARAGFANAALEAASGADAAALGIARRHDPYTVAGDAARDRQAVEFADRLAPFDRAAVQAAGLRKASFVLSPAAKPFRMAAPLDASRDLECLTDAVYYEARGEGLAGMQAVAQVVLNRVRHPAFPKSVCGVVFQGAAGGGCQFSFACDGSMRRGVEASAWRRSREVAAKALAGYVMTEVGNATHFHTTSVTPGWRGTMLRVAQVGAHIFYRFGGGAGAPGAFSYQPKPSTGAEHPITVLASLGPVPASAAAQAPAPAYTILHKDDAAPKADTPKPADIVPAKADLADAPKADAVKIAAPAPGAG